ncbi:hypothetical protein AT15_08920 [Kosmotoga arenicorallina S304]|uniref:Uncharacterized protein n=1 Tax=Kosmotoga arenicorallina S304 TaxID=1453497 RepID=A0A176K1R8_9BACT|nr:hypothetical protein [Kosmotoga arenicorallina]OAA31087.1 hypothetical protein AT15_08920 [Kosmotoga arenicorallina S304]
MIKPFIKIQYPPSKKIFRTFKASDLISYSGRIYVFDEENFSRYRFYEEHEGTQLFSLANEMAFLKENALVSREILEYLFVRGIVATVGVDVDESLISIYRRFSRLHLLPFDDNSRKVLEKSAPGYAEFKDLRLYVGISSSGYFFRREI